MTRCKRAAGSPIDDLQRILDASRNLHRLILSLLDPAAVHQADGDTDLAEYRRTLRHDLRTPINAIKGYGEMLREDAADGRRGRVGRRSRQAAGRSNPAARPDRWSGDVFWRRCSAIGWSWSRPPPRLPHRRRWSRACSRRSARSPTKEADLAAVQPSRILVVDDNASNRDLLSRRLQRQGHTVLQAEDGTTALALVEKEALDLVLLDLMMPGISGYDVLTLLKSDPRFREIPVIMISALSELNSIVRCIEAGADDYLAKPFDPTLLRARVGSSLEKKHMRDREREMVEALRIEKERSEQLLLNILPKAIVARLNGDETFIADQLSNVTILFADHADAVLVRRRGDAGGLDSLGRLDDRLEDDSHRDRRGVVQSGRDQRGVVGDLPQGVLAVQVLAPGQEPDLVFAQGLHAIVPPSVVALVHSRDRLSSSRLQV